MRFGIDRRAARRRARNLADLLQRVEVEHHQVPGAVSRDIKAAAQWLGENVVKAALAAHARRLQNFVGTIGRARLRKGRRRQNRYYCEDNRCSHKNPPWDAGRRSVPLRPLIAHASLKLPSNKRTSRRKYTLGSGGAERKVQNRRARRASPLRLAKRRTTWRP